MVDLMANCTGDGCFEMEQELLDFSSMSHHEILFKGIKIFEKMIVTLTNRCRALADSLDAKDAQHAEEMENVKRAHEAKLNEMNDQINEHLTTLNNAHNENRSKAAVCERLTEGLRHIREQIGDLIDSMENEDEQSEGDSVLSEQENDVVGDGDNNDNDDDDDDDDDIQRDAEQQNGHPNDGTLPIGETQEEGDADQGQDDDDDPMATADNRENVAGAQNDKENVQPPPQNAVAVPSTSSPSPTTAPLQPVSVAQPLANSSNANRVKKCFKCDETFVQESVFIDHLSRFHGIVITNSTSETEDENEPGQYVRNPALKRKNITRFGNIASDENANDRKAGRKIKKASSTPDN